MENIKTLINNWSRKQRSWKLFCFEIEKHRIYGTPTRRVKSLPIWSYQFWKVVVFYGIVLFSTKCRFDALGYHIWYLRLDLFPSESSSKLDDELRFRPDFNIGFLGILFVEVSDVLTGRVAGCKRLKKWFHSNIKIVELFYCMQYRPGHTSALFRVMTKACITNFCSTI